MEIVKTKGEIVNKNLFLIIIGILILPVADTFVSLINGLVAILFDLSVQVRANIALILDATVCFALAITTILVVRRGRGDVSNGLIVLGRKKLMIIAIVFLIILISGRSASYFWLRDISQELTSLVDDGQPDLARATLNLQIASVTMTIVRDILLFVILFLIVSQNKLESKTLANNRYVPLRDAD